MRRREQVRQRLREQIAAHGWSVMAVAPGAEDGTGWAYTIGLTETFVHPELALVGFPRERAHGLLNAAAELVRDGKRLTADTRTAGVLAREDLPG